MPSDPINVDHDHAGALWACNPTATALRKGMIVILADLPTRQMLAATPALPDNADTGRLLYVVKHDIPPGEIGIVLPWMVWEDGFAHWSAVQAGLAGEVSNQPAPPGLLTIFSSAAGDTSKPIVILGKSSGTLYAETVLTNPSNGTTPVTTTRIYDTVYGASKPVTTGTITVQDVTPDTVFSMAPAVLTRGLVQYGYDTPDAGPGFQGVSMLLSSGGGQQDVIILGVVDGVTTLKLVATSEGATIFEMTPWDRIDYIAYGKVPSNHTVTVRGTRDLDNATLPIMYLDSATPGRMTRNAPTSGSVIPTGWILGTNRALLDPNGVRAGYLGGLIASINAGLANITASLPFIGGIVLTKAAESGNAIDVTLQVVDKNGLPWVGVVRILCALADNNMLQTLVANWRLAEVGAGTEVSATAQPRLLIDTSAAGLAVVRITDVSGVSTATVWFSASPVMREGGPVSAPATPAIISATFA